MTMYLSEALARCIHDAMRAGRDATEDDVIRDALTRLKQSMPDVKQPPARRGRRARATPARPAKPLTIEELHQKFLAEDRISQLPDTASDHDDQPITVEGEPL